MVPIPDSVRQIPGRKSEATQELVFFTTLPPLGYKTYNVKRKAENTENIKDAAVAGFIGNEVCTILSKLSLIDTL